MDTPKKDQVDQVVQAILNPSGNPQNFILTLTQFKELYQQIYGQRGDTKIDVVLNGEWALVQFSELCNQRIRVLPDNLFRPSAKFLGRKLYLEKKDFEIAFSSTTFFGQLEYLTTWRFLKEEAQVNGVKAILIFALSGLFFSISSTSSAEVIKSANDILIAVSAVFFSIFLLFTVSQNLPFVDLALFKRGLPHRFVQVDKKVAYLAIIALGIAAVNRTLATNPVIQIPQTFLWSKIAIDLTIFLNWSTALGVTIIAISLLTVVQYYFKRAESIYETGLSKKLLDEVFKERNKE